MWKIETIPLPERARKTRLAYADKTVIPGLYAAASVVLGWNGEAACAVATSAGDPSYRTIKGILAAGTETRPATQPADA